MKDEKDDEITLTRYRDLYLGIPAILFLIAFLLYIVVPPAFHSKNPFAVFIELHERRDALFTAILICYIVLTGSSISGLFAARFKIIFNEEGIHIYSLRFINSYLIKWEDLKEFQVKQLSYKGLPTPDVQVLAVSDGYTTKTANSVGPTFRAGSIFKLKDGEEDKTLITVEQINKLYQKHCHLATRNQYKC